MNNYERGREEKRLFSYRNQVQRYLVIILELPDHNKKHVC